MSLATVEGVLVRDCTPNFEFVRIINDGDVSVKTRCKTCLLECTFAHSMVRYLWY